MSRLIIVSAVVSLTFLISCGGSNDPSKQSGDSGFVPQNQGDSDNTGDSTPQGSEFNEGWIGGACDSTSDCDNSDMIDPECLTSGFPNGFCSQDCSYNSGSDHWVCPDTDYSGSNTISRCIDGNGEPVCASECDFAESPQTGCRPGYMCVSRSRYESPEDIFPVCVPGDGLWPGETPPAFDIGEPCFDHGDCAYNACLPAQDGYCSKVCSQTSPCPEGSTCMQVAQVQTGEGPIPVCLLDCDSTTDCRDDEGFACLQAADSDSINVCWSMPPPWDNSVGIADCQAAWGNLHACDTTPDNYVVINKSARNVALCANGDHVESFHGALGFSPIGDKEQEGDGKTPEGTFYVARKFISGTLYKAFLVSYPDSDDADRGSTAGLIDATEKAAIEAAESTCDEPPQTTGLGGYIELHGESWPDAWDWTAGCVAVENTILDDHIWDALDTFDTVVVLP